MERVSKEMKRMIKQVNESTVTHKYVMSKNKEA